MNENPMNDVEVERRLVLAGTLWRETEPLPPEPDLARMTGRSHRALAVVAAAAAVGLVAAGGLVLLGGGSGGGPGGGPAATAPPPSEQLRSLDRVAVHNGSKVRATGTVIAERGKPAVLCLGATYDGSAGHPTCLPWQDIRLTGPNVGTLPPTGTRVDVVGTWRDRTIAVTSASAHPQADPSSLPQIPPPRPPCPAPPGGWRAGPLADQHALDAYLAADPDRFGGSDITFPDGNPGGPTGAAGYPTVAQVVVVEVATGDLATAQADLARRYSGNLCVERAAFSQRQQDGAEHDVTRLLTGLHQPVLSMGGSAKGVFTYVPVVDDTLYPRLAAIENRYGTGILQINTDVVPIR